MHRFSLAVAAAGSALALTQIASAADMPIKVPAYKSAVAVAPSWTGLYVGGGVGYGMYNADTIWFLPTGAPFQPLTQTQGGRGWLGTVNVGYDYQFNNNIVAGVLADYDLASIKGTIQDQGPFTVGTMTENSAWAIGARAGSPGGMAGGAPKCGCASSQTLARSARAGGARSAPASSTFAQASRCRRCFARVAAT